MERISLFKYRVVDVDALKVYDKKLNCITKELDERHEESKQKNILHHLGYTSEIFNQFVVNGHIIKQFDEYECIAIYNYFGTFYVEIKEILYENRRNFMLKLKKFYKYRISSRILHDLS